VGDHIDGLSIAFPATSGYLTVSRLNAAAVGAAAGFDVDEIDDFRLAVNEAVSWLVADADAGGTVELVMHAADGRVRLDGFRRTPSLPERDSDDLIEAILGATVDEFELKGRANGERRVHLGKRCAATNGG